MDKNNFDNGEDCLKQIENFLEKKRAEISNEIRINHANISKFIVEYKMKLFSHNGFAFDKCVVLYNAIPLGIVRG